MCTLSLSNSESYSLSANILLADNWSAAVGDYGVMRVQPSTGSMVTTTVAGTTEYMDPDYLRGGVVSEKTDVYSFGVVSGGAGAIYSLVTCFIQVLFELLLGAAARGPICYHGNIENTDIVTFVEGFEDEVSTVIVGVWPVGVAKAVWDLAEQCIEERALRPSSNEVSPSLPLSLH